MLIKNGLLPGYLWLATQSLFVVDYWTLWQERFLEKRDEIRASMTGLTAARANLEKLFKENNLLSFPPPGVHISAYPLVFVDGGEGILELVGGAAYFVRASSLYVAKSVDNPPESAFTRLLDMGFLDYDAYVKERVEFIREALEFDVAEQTVRERKPAVLFLDGSLFVKTYRHAIDCEEHRRYRMSFERLLHTCESREVTVVGVSEDSTSRLLLNHLSQRFGCRFPRYLTDVAALGLVSRGEVMQTVEFVPVSTYSLQDTSQEARRFPTFYLRPTPSARPLRIDRAPWGLSREGVRDLILSLSAGSGAFGYPLPLYLVHRDAHITPAQSAWSSQQLVRFFKESDADLAGVLFSRTRRDLRP